MGKQQSLRLPGLELPAVVEGRTYFGKSVRDPDTMKNLLVSGDNNGKIGKTVTIGKHRGATLYTLTLEERATCPRSCYHWQTCYGNNMPFAKRVDHRHPRFLELLEANIDRLIIQHAGRVIIRLHALGDFYSAAYVVFWARMLRDHPTLVIFGYTAWRRDTEIGMVVHTLVDSFSGRAMIRVSNGGYRSRSTVPIVEAAACPPGAFVCPEQTGQFASCSACGACWTTLKNVAFLAH